MYSTYAEYQARGGTLPEPDYRKHGTRASYIIDHHTMGRARDAPACMADALCDCECALIDALAEGHFARDGVQSFTNDGYSETRATAAQPRAALRGLLAEYLTVPVNLLAFAGRAVV